jgi:hypothetical protein
MYRKKEIDTETNTKVIEWLKAELVDNVAVLLKSLLRTGSEVTSDALATIIIVVYILGRRLGINFRIIDLTVRHKLNSSLNVIHDVEWNDDLRQLQTYLESKESKKR